MKIFLSKNWFNIITIIIAICALFITLSGNMISFAANTPRVEIIGNYTSYGIIVVWGCFDQNATEPYQITREASEFLTFVNRGGRTVSLLKASFSEGAGDYRAVNFYDIDPNNLSYYPSDNQQLKLPIDIEAGTGRIWLINTSNLSYWETVDDALNAINYPDPRSNTLPEIPKPALWKFEFSDGTIINRKYTSGWYHIQPDIDSYMQNSPCK